MVEKQAKPLTIKEEEKEKYNGNEAKEAESHENTPKREGKYIPPHLRDEMKEKETNILMEHSRKITRIKDFSIPCKLNSFNVSSALCDFDAYINVLSS